MQRFGVCVRSHTWHTLVHLEYTEGGVMSTGVERVATWECHVCPRDEQVLRRGPHYTTAESATAGLRHHFMTEHAAQLWADGGSVTGAVLEFEHV